VSKVLRSPCNLCGRETDHDIVTEEHSSEDGPNGEARGINRYTLRCRGCHDFSLRADEWFHDGVPSEDTETIITATCFQPPRLWRRPPDWLNDVQNSDADLHGLLEEIYSVANDSQVRLLSMGTRAALDHLMNVGLGGDYGSFEDKLSQMVSGGHLTEAQKESLEIIVDAGSASSHRGYKPARQAMLMTMEGLVQNHYITGPMLKTAKANIPPRPPRQKRKGQPVSRLAEIVSQNTKPR
jgi:hypothetical protein